MTLTDKFITIKGKYHKCMIENVTMLLFRIKKYTELVLKYNQINPIDFLNSPNFIKITQLETIHL
jgi:hypothetical protein